MNISELEGFKVTTASAMAMIEAQAIAEGDATAFEYMQNAGQAIAKVVDQFTCQNNLDKRVLLLCYKGNNSGDAYVAGIELIQRGYDISAYELCDIEETSSLCKKQRERFYALSGRSSQNVIDYRGGLILDGLLGTGFKGALDETFKQLIDRVNALNAPIISIDIPSGIHGDTGIAGGAFLKASHTIALGAYKKGHFFSDGYLAIGDLSLVSFGMSKKYLDLLEGYAYLPKANLLSTNLPRLSRSAQKYEVGQVVGIAGSHGMSGAAILSSESALKGGAGIVKLFHPKGMEAEFSQMLPEIIKTSWEDEKRLAYELSRAKALFVGPGLGKAPKIGPFLEKLIGDLTLPMVIDADGLFFYPSLRLKSEQVVLTPHGGELSTLLRVKMGNRVELIDKAQEFSDKNQVVIVCKGGPTVVVAPKEPKMIIPFGNPGMASAGMGDVLTGIISAMLARGKTAREAAILGCYVHALAGDRAAKLYSMAAMSASDLISCLGEVFLEGQG